MRRPEATWAIAAAVAVLVCIAMLTVFYNLHRKPAYVVDEDMTAEARAIALETANGRVDQAWAYENGDVIIRLSRAGGMQDGATGIREDGILADALGRRVIEDMPTVTFVEVLIEGQVERTYRRSMQ